MMRPIFSLVLIVCLATWLSISATEAQVTLDASKVVPIATVHKITKDNDIVLIRGTISRMVDDNKYMLRDESGSIEVNFDRQRTMGITLGQDVTVRGEVRKYLTRARRVNATEAVINTNPNAVTPPVTPPPNLIPIWQAYFRASDGEIVTVGGKIIRKLDSGELVLRDNSGEILINHRFVSGGVNALSIGQAVMVTGEVDIYWGGPWREIEPRTIQPLTTTTPAIPPVQLVVIPIAEVLSGNNLNQYVTVQGELSRQLDDSDYLINDDSGQITILINPRIFSHHRIQIGKTYTVTGKVEVDPLGEKRIVVMILTEVPLAARPADEPKLIEDLVEVPISSVYYDYLSGAVVTISGSVIRKLGENGLILQDNTGAIVVDYDTPRFQTLDLTIGRFLIITGEVQSTGETDKSLKALNIYVRGRPGE
jgi:uncharacterized protein YdeI (BOF family)